MTKILFIFMFYFVSMYSLLIIMDMYVGFSFNESLQSILSPFEVTDPGELVILIIFAMISIAIPLKYYFKLFITKQTSK